MPVLRFPLPNLRRVPEMNYSRIKKARASGALAFIKLLILPAKSTENSGDGFCSAVNDLDRAAVGRFADLCRVDSARFADAEEHVRNRDAITFGLMTAG